MVKKEAMSTWDMSTFTSSESITLTYTMHKSGISSHEMVSLLYITMIYLSTNTFTLKWTSLLATPICSKFTWDFAYFSTAGHQIQLGTIPQIYQG